MLLLYAHHTDQQKHTTHENSRITPAAHLVLCVTLNPADDPTAIYCTSHRVTPFITSDMRPGV